MKLHVLGICGTFMGGLARLAQALGHQVSGSDQNVYPPMSTQLQQAGIGLCEGYDPDHIPADCDQVIVGNALSRGNPALEAVLNRGLDYTSGPQWLGEHLLRERRVIAVAGTHGKTTTASMLAWMLESAGLDPGFLIGGVPENFSVSARLGHGDWFVIEADEYDTAFFDKRSKFVHYRPLIAVLNNLEFDHADIFPDLAAIQTQFHHLLRTVPGNGTVVSNADDPNLAAVLERGCWSQLKPFGTGAAWHSRFTCPDHSRFEIHSNKGIVQGQWSLSGQHNLDNATAAVCAATEAGVEPEQAVAALADFRLPKRRQELLASVGDIELLDDFAHHPTAIATTLRGLRARYPGRRLVAVIEPRSNSMRRGAHNATLAAALDQADLVMLVSHLTDWEPREVLQSLGQKLILLDDPESVPEAVVGQVRAGDCVVFMSNGGFGGAPAATVKLLGSPRV